MKLSENDLINLIIRRLYEAFFTIDPGYDLNIVRGESDWDEQAFWRLIDRLYERDLVRMQSAGGFYSITHEGIEFAEEQVQIEPNLKKRNQVIRTKALSWFVKRYRDQNDRASMDDALQQISISNDEDFNVVLSNIQVLLYMGLLIKRVGEFQVSEYGMTVYENYEKRRALVSEFEEISTLEPSPRGRALQELLAKLFDRIGWLPSEGVRTSIEEIDIVIHKSREYYLTECKWEKKAIGAPVIRELYGKMENRAHIHGILFSMSGFASTAVSQVKKYGNKRMIFLFGANDITKLFGDPSSFEAMLDAKFEAFILRENVVFE